MRNLNSKQVLDVINKFIMAQYARKLKDVKRNDITLFKTFPHTGAPNISEPVTITIFENLEKLLSEKYNLCQN